jgi:septum formation protein
MSEAPSRAHGAPRLVLASVSPRRRRLFTWYGVAFDVDAVEVDESPDPSLSGDLRAVAADISMRKARAARAGHQDDVVVACDTLVSLDGEMLGKPRDLDDAHRMLESLSGRKHQVVTGVAVLLPGDEEPANLSVVTNVHMHELTPEDVATWANEGELLGCAGAYNIERHLAWVDDDECYQNVAGLPLCHLYLLLSALAQDSIPDRLERPDATCDATRGAFCKIGPCMLGRCC